MKCWRKQLRYYRTKMVECWAQYPWSVVRCLLSVVICMLSVTKKVWELLFRRDITCTGVGAAFSRDMSLELGELFLSKHRRKQVYEAGNSSPGGFQS